jgi:repressor LexA
MLKNIQSGLTKRQSDILSFVKKVIQDNGIPPTITEICHWFNFSSTNGVHQHLKALEKKGYIKKLNKGASRGIILLKSDETQSIEDNIASENIKKLTIIGNGKAQKPHSVFMSNKGTIHVDTSYFDLTDDHFAAIASDNGLSGSGITPGDILIVKDNKEQKEGDIVFALVNDLSVARRFHNNHNGFELRSDTKGFPKMSFSPNDPTVAILGKVCGVLKKL